MRTGVPTHDLARKRRNRITGGGVTAGIDFGLVVLAQLRDQKTAELQQLIMEYAARMHDRL